MTWTTQNRVDPNVALWQGRLYSAHTSFALASTAKRLVHVRTRKWPVVLHALSVRVKKDGRDITVEWSHGGAATGTPLAQTALNQAWHDAEAPFAELLDEATVSEPGTVGGTITVAGEYAGMPAQQMAVAVLAPETGYTFTLTNAFAQSSDVLFDLLFSRAQTASRND